jgi:tetratricopeptide (TPR) repeat protein
MVTVTDPHDWHRIGLEHLHGGRTQEAIHALEQAEQSGLADAAYELGQAYRRLARHADAEQAWLRVLRHTTRRQLRVRAGERLAELYSDLGAPRTYAEMQAYLGALRGMVSPRVPPARVQRGADGTYRVNDGRGLVRRLNDRWQRWSRPRRVMVALASVVTALLALAERLGWLMEVLRRW